MAWDAWGDPALAKPLSSGIRTLLEQALGQFYGSRLQGALRIGGRGQRRDSVGKTLVQL